MNLFKIMCLAVLSCSAFAEKPFVDMSFPEALAEAKATGKLVMIDFYTTWCPPCKLLDETTWKDEAVQKWLEENTVPLKVDAERLAIVAKKYDVVAYPSIVFINSDRLTIGRIVGYRSPEDFVQAAENAIAWIPDSERLKKVVEEDPLNIGHKLRLGSALEKEKKYSEALDQYVWCWEEREKDDDSVFINLNRLSYISSLLEEYPPARTKIEEWRDIAKKEFESESITRKACNEYFELERILGMRGDNLLEIYDEISICGAVSKQNLSWLGKSVVDAMFANGRYEDYLEFQDIDNIINNLDNQRIEEYNVPYVDWRGDPMPEHIIVYRKLEIDNNRQRNLKEVIKPWEALIALHQDELSGRLLKALVRLDDRDQTIKQFVRTATQSNRSDLIEKIEELANPVSQIE